MQKDIREDTNTSLKHNKKFIASKIDNVAIFVVLTCN